MKKIFTILTAVLLTAILWAQSPEKMSYQAVIRDANDNLVTNQTVGMQISILQGSSSGTAVYVETQTPTTNANGLVSIEIGIGTVVSGDFTTIDWVNGSYYLKTETDPAGGTNYTITGISQLLSVPYALHAKTAETISGGITETDPAFTAWDKSTGISITESQISDLDHFTNGDETDPIFNASVASSITATDTANWNSGQGSFTESDPTYTVSQAANITATDITNLGNLSGTNTGDQDISGITTNTQAIQDTAAQIRADIPDVSGFLTSETDPSVPTGTQAGEMQYWNGTAWITVAAGNEGQVLTFVSGVPTWKAIESNIDVTNPITGEIWMDRNLGASQVATSSTDAAAYGDLYQWGRAADGHESRTSGTTSTLSSSDTPGHGDFITVGSSPYDWRSPQNDNLWQGVSGTNNPCPSGYRLPTEAEWEAERASWSSNNAAGAYASPLKLSVAGRRHRSNGSLYGVGSYGSYWSSTVAGTYSRNLYFLGSNAYMYSSNRANGYSVRCLKD